VLQAGRSRFRVLLKWIYFSLPNTSSHGIALGSTRPLNRHEFQESPGWGGKGGLRVRLTSRLWADCLDNVGTSTSHNPMGLHGLSQGQVYFFYLLLLIQFQLKCLDMCFSNCPDLRNEKLSMSAYKTISSAWNLLNCTSQIYVSREYRIFE
jgi:hypothetical protein